MALIRADHRIAHRVVEAALSARLFISHFNFAFCIVR